MPDQPVGESDLRDRATKVELQFSAFENFTRGVRKITLTDVPSKETEGSIVGIGILVLYDDGTTDTFYATLSARRPTGVQDPNDLV